MRALWLFTIALSWLAIAEAKLSLPLSQQSLSYREVNVTIDDCTADLCSSMEEWRSYPNLAFFLSIEPDWKFHRGEGEHLDMIASYVSSVGFPSNVHCYFHADATYDLKIDWDAFLKGEPNSVSIGTGYFCIGFVLERIIEYEDNDDNGDYNPIVDTLISQYNFPIQGTWNRAQTTTRNNVYYLNTTTKDATVSLQWTSASVLTKERGSDFMITPNATRLEIEINNYPYEKNTTKLAIKGYIATDGVDEEDFIEEITSTESHIIMGKESNKGYFSWSNVAIAYLDSVKDGLRIPVDTPVAIGFKVGKPTSLPLDIEFGLVKAILGTSATIRDVCFSFTEVSQPAYVKWYAATGYGEPPKRDYMVDVLVTLGLFLGLAIPAIAVFVIVRSRIAAAQSNEEAAPILPSKPPVPSSHHPIDIRHHRGSLLGPNSDRNSINSLMVH